MSQTRLNNTQTLSRSLSEMEAMKPVDTEDTRSIGIAWALIRPFLTMVVFTVVFGKLAKL